MMKGGVKMKKKNEKKQRKETFIKKKHKVNGRTETRSIKKII